MRVGSFDKQIVILRSYGRYTINEFGAAKPATENGIPMRAALIETTSTDVAGDNGRVTQTVLTLKTHFLPDVKAGDRVTFNRHTYEVLEAHEIGRRKSLELKVIKRA
jgi:hypothetical protein